MDKLPRKKALKSRQNLPNAQNDRITDSRFANIQTDPKFRLPSKKNTHVQIDKRFERMLRDEGFSNRAKVDRFGRKLPKDAGRKELERYYRIQEDQDGLSEDNEVELELRRADAKLRKEEVPSSAEESSSGEESDLDVSEEEEVFGLLDGQEADGDGIPLGEVTSRIAVVNLDWDNIRATDLMAVFSSFVLNAGHIKSISIYPSSFGKERMEREEMEGPPKEIFAERKSDMNAGRIDQAFSEDEEDQDPSVDENDEEIKKSLLQENTSQDFNSAKLRRYKLERLRYYYAVVVCSSPSVAQRLYEAVDGTEYLTTANFFDLRFIPDRLDFSMDKPRDECTKVPDGHRPNEFVTDALQHSKVRLTWDIDDGARKEVQKRAFAASRANIDENDLKAYLGSDSSDEEGDAPEPVIVDATITDVQHSEKPSDAASKAIPKISKKEAERQRMRALLGLDPQAATSDTPENLKSDKSGPVGDMQVTFSSGLTSVQPKNNSVFINSPDHNQETTVEKYVRKEKERKARRKSKLKALHEGVPVPESDTANPNHSNNAPSNEATSPADNEKEQDLGFADPFFADPDSKPAAPNNKKAKRLKKAERTAEEAASSAQRSELELLTMPDSIDPSQERGIQHFNIKDILRAERVLAKSKKSKKKSKLTERDREAFKAKEQDEFRLDVKDPRFGAVYERPEFAIDPSHPRFLGTGAMKELLEEGRRKRKVIGEGEDEDENGNKSREEKKVKRGEGRHRDGDEGPGEDVGRLVEKIKRRAKS
ncbi:MAG: hypothetical protein Q9219_002777 [cf. Caloplaca sp. 3 TL-2023]